MTATLTATSADACRDGWVVRVVVDRTEGAVQGVDGLALEAEPYVGVDASGDANVCVAQQLLDEVFDHAVQQGQGNNWFTTQREMAFLERAFRVGNLDSSRLRFYLGGTDITSTVLKGSKYLGGSQ
ncbi:hypothetical protein ACIRRX_30990 [Streptomyces bacillaris]